MPMNKDPQHSEESMKSSEEQQLTLHYIETPMNKCSQPHLVKSELQNPRNG